MRFILFDDDPVNNTLNHLTIKNTFKEAEIITFTAPEKGFQFISSEFLEGENLILIDINMPGMTCWEFIDRFEKLDSNIKNKFKICILSASLSPQDKNLAAENKLIADYIEKPLTAEKIRGLPL